MEPMGTLGDGDLIRTSPIHQTRRFGRDEASAERAGRSLEGGSEKGISCLAKASIQSETGGWLAPSAGSDFVL